MKKRQERVVEDLVDSVQAANDLIAELGRRDGVDTSAYGFMVRRTGAMSLALHRGSHPSEEVVDARRDPRDPRLPKAQPGTSVSGAFKTGLRRDIEERHEELVHLHRWHEVLAGRRPLANDFRWDPVLLDLLRGEEVDLDALLDQGPGTFVSEVESRNRQDIPIVSRGRTPSGLSYIGVIDGDTVRALRIRYSRDATYSWSRRQPGHVELEIRGPLPIPRIVLDEAFSDLFDHPSLAKMHVQSYAQQGSTTSFKSATRLVRT